ncbi:MAG: hypothetical protein NUV85_02720 [Candidatus Berkelbacteria bacterium]|nr:hypothetical protein [Candidatus Berkelbacteria bacterium]
MSWQLPEDLFVGKRVFQYDYIYIDAFFLAVWIVFLLWRREFKALIFSAVIAPIIYAIDAILWWNRSAGPHYPLGTHIREYWIAGSQVNRPEGVLWLQKFGSDFMMTISYSFFAFAWMWIMFHAIRNGRLLTRPVVMLTLAWLACWLLVPLLSKVLPIDDRPVIAVRYMYSQFPLWIANFLMGYALLAVVYRRRLSVVGQLFLVGLIGSIVMEVPLYLFGIRPTSLVFLIFEGVFLLNQGVPWLFLLIDRVWPWLVSKSGRGGRLQVVSM